MITRAIGAAHEVEPDFFAVELRDGDTLLLASDGLTRYVEDDSIGTMIDPQDLEGSCQRLVNAAKQAGGADNITTLLLRYNTPAPVSALLPTLESDSLSAQEAPASSVDDAPATEPSLQHSASNAPATADEGESGPLSATGAFGNLLQ